MFLLPQFFPNWLLLCSRKLTGRYKLISNKLVPSGIFAALHGSCDGDHSGAVAGERTIAAKESQHVQI
jgi:hypothetical protein